MAKINNYLIVLLVLFSTSFCYAQADKVDLEPLKISITNGTVTVSDTATLIPTSNLSGRRVIIIVNISTSNIFLGSSTVTTSNGYQLYSQQSISLDISDDISIYGIVSSGTAEVRFIEAR